MEERATILIGNAGHGSRGEKVIEVQYHSPFSSFGPHGILVIEDRLRSYVREFENGGVDVSQDNKLSDYPALTICKLAISLAQIYTEETLKKQPESKVTLPESQATATV